MKHALPFQLSKEKSFFESLGDWMGDVLYDEFLKRGLSVVMNKFSWHIKLKKY